MKYAVAGIQEAPQAIQEECGAFARAMSLNGCRLITGAPIGIQAVFIRYATDVRQEITIAKKLEGVEFLLHYGQASQLIKREAKRLNIPTYEIGVDHFEDVMDNHGLTIAE